MLLRNVCRCNLGKRSRLVQGRRQAPRDSLAGADLVLLCDLQQLSRRGEVQLDPSCVEPLAKDAIAQHV